MAITQQKILFRRGNRDDLIIADLQPGEPSLALDTNEFGVKSSGGDMLWAPMIIDKDDGTGTTHYEKYADGRVHEWGSYSMDIAYTVKYGDTMYFHSDTNDTSIALPVPIDTSKSYDPNVSFDSSGIVWCANAIVKNAASNGTTTSTLYYRTVSGSEQTSLSVTIRWEIWGFWK
jgi:beta-xylosidase